ncbi:tRNA(Met) cytidine acetyltransferase [Pseudoalteromonas ulvae UL12]|uniref:tRNA(Met) cytidine acetyltransferase TmcA n=1 Tax=Pseudoalteromonas ulvae TaxID=107327 RepID=A0A244CKV5_PSEDV|nr:GNAT family N-acetyltransferase [Pseudoalteromonas ulvae]MBE0361905.1 tRNA(Met) cytidine acetyltransferase [Pseudoalteromonas ulvae UL12]OUL55910.1 hypothetical protein B1199_20745 [Pseudoalteromonas ulvae]
MSLSFQLNNYLSQLTQNRHRQLLVITGEQSWVYQQALQLSEDCSSSPLILSNHELLQNAIWPEHTHQLLGQENQHVIYDGFSGLKPNLLAAVSGTVRAGGLLILLLPSRAQLNTFIDPQFSSYQSAEQSSARSNFNTRFNRTLTQCFCIFYDQNDGLYIPDISPQSSEDPYVEQQAALKTLQKYALGRAHRPVLLRADRGRGKSAALGITAAMLAYKGKRVTICAAQKSAIDTTFQFYHSHLALKSNQVQPPAGALQFVPPDQLFEYHNQTDVLLIDEAATLPVPFLIKTLHTFNRIIFATTEHGYEGSGRGFTLRFCPYIKQHFAGAHFISLHQPIRFAAQDPLENHINRLLCLDAESSDTQNDDTTHFALVTQEELSQDEALLKQVFALLVMAHYQTSANDLRHLLDAAGLKIFIATQHNRVIGTALVQLEGQLSHELSEQIITGSRRPKGHLMAQSLAQLTGDSKDLQRSMARIVRITVQPQLQRQQIGKQLLSFIEATLAGQISIIGASFGGQAELINFWQSQAYRLCKVGFSKDHISGEHACLMIKDLAEEISQLTLLNSRFNRDLPLNLMHHFSHLDHHLVLQLLTDTKHDVAQMRDVHIVKRYLNGQLQFADSFASCWRLLWHCHHLLNECSINSQAMLIKLILQKQTLQSLALELNINGKKSLQINIKEAINEWFLLVEGQFDTLFNSDHTLT